MDLQKAFDTVDHNILLGTRGNTMVSEEQLINGLNLIQKIESRLYPSAFLVMVSQ